MSQGEFDFISAISRRFAPLLPPDMEGIGDDCAVIPAQGDEAYVITTDMLVEGVHFLRASASGAVIGAKSLAVNLSDVAAMGARPVASLLSLALPPSARGEWADDFMEGYRALSQRCGVALIGGDTVAADEAVVVNVVAVGRAKMSHLKRRSAARAGDVVMVAGELGASGAGLRDILAGRFDTAAARLHLAPEAQIEQGVWLGARTEVHAMMDISDGLASDLRHILHLSRVGARIETTAIPAFGGDVETAVCGGEDYKLLFTVCASAAQALAADYAERFGSEPYAIGEITSDADNLSWLRRGEVITPDWRGFSHY